MGTYTKIVGNGKSLNAPIVGVKNTEGFWWVSANSFWRGFWLWYGYLWLSCSFVSLKKQLNVKVGDTVKARFNTISGQVQAVNLQVLAIATTNSSFMDFVLYMDVNKMRKLLGYNSWEIEPCSLQ